MPVNRGFPNKSVGWSLCQGHLFSDFWAEPVSMNVNMTGFGEDFRRVFGSKMFWKQFDVLLAIENILRGCRFCKFDDVLR